MPVAGYYIKKRDPFNTVLEVESPRPGSSICLAYGEGLLGLTQHGRGREREMTMCKKRPKCIE
jgi:hypothetical protein